MSKRLSILGCGWLGLPLAEAFVETGWQVNGSTTSSSKLALLLSKNIHPYQIKCADDMQVTSGCRDDFFNVDVLIITLPFKRSFKNPRDYFHHIVLIMQAVQDYRVKRVLFTSSTSVYPNHNQTVTEDMTFTPENDRAQTLWDIENMLLSQQYCQSSIVRFAGLYGGDRVIGRFRAGQTLIPNGSAPVNLIHLEDAVGILREIVLQECWGHIFNGCSDFHPRREDLYTAAAIAGGVSKPTFNNQSAVYKIVDNTKVKKILQYAFLHPNPMGDI